jgi:hypothetical protein
LGRDEYEFVVGSHNVQLDNPREKTYYGRNIYHFAAQQLGLRRIPKGYVVYGEIFGPGVQDLTYGRDALDVRFFDVMYEGEYLNFMESCRFFEEQNLEMVPILKVVAWGDDLLHDLSFTCSRLDENTMMEGVVVKPTAERTHPLLGRVILKIINPEYLLRKKGTENK